jgi:hypothetical protein
MARPPAEHPRSIQIAFRVTDEVSHELTKLSEAEARPGESLSEHEMARILMHEALEKRRKVRR